MTIPASPLSPVRTRRSRRPTPVRSVLPLCALLTAVAAGFPDRPLAANNAETSPRDTEEWGVPRFTDIYRETGIDFRHVSGPSDRKDYIFEAKGGGVGLFDFDNDGWLDIFLVQGSTLELVGTARNPGSRLYRNRRNGTFEDVTERAGINYRHWGMGVTFGDYDNDGLTDIYETHFGPNVLYRNGGDGTFVNATAAAGVGDPRWSTSAAFADFDGDGFLDLYVANYLDYGGDNLPPGSDACTYLGRVVMCGPRGLAGAADILYRNNGNGTFCEATEETGAVDRESYFGLGVLWTDLNNDGHPDIYVANDATPNLLFVNDGRGRFEEMGFLSGLAVSGDGAMQASMGIDAADFDNDGLLDVFAAHFASDFSTLYRNEGDLVFKDVTGEAGIQASEWLLVAWSAAFIDVNHDGWKDLLHVNGHVYPFLLDGGTKETYGQAATLYLNQKNGTFADVSPMAGADFLRETVSRGAAFGDIDNDGDIDVVVANMDDVPQVLRNDRTDRNHWVMFHLKDRRDRREQLGARVEIVCGPLKQVREIRRTVGIYSASDPRAHFGTGSCETLDRVEVRWVDGTASRFEGVRTGKHYVVDKSGTLEPEEFAKP